MAESGDLVENEAAWTSRTWLLVLAVLLPAVTAYGILYRQGFSVPYQDDYKAVLGFALEYVQLPTWRAKVVDVATKQYNEYKLGFEHSIVASELELTHHLNFGFLIALGDLFLLPIAFLLWRIQQENEADVNRRLLAFVPISLMFFSLSYWENLDWAMTGLQNTAVIVFSLLALYLLVRTKMLQPGRAHFLMACLSAAVAACCSANGFLLAPVGLMFLLPRRAYLRGLIWCLSFILPLACYLYHYTPQVHPLQRVYYSTRPLFFLALLGSVIPLRWPAALLGAMMLIVLFLAFLQRLDQTRPAWFYFALWIVATAALTGWVRGGAGFTTVSRYSIYSVLMLIFCYAFLAQYVPNRWPIFTRTGFYVTSLLVAAVMYFLVDLHAYRHLGTRRHMVLSGIELYRANPEVNSPMVDPVVEQAFPAEKAEEHAILTRAIQDHLYALPPRQEIR